MIMEYHKLTSDFYLWVLATLFTAIVVLAVYFLFQRFSEPFKPIRWDRAPIQADILIGDATPQDRVGCGRRVRG